MSNSDVFLYPVNLDLHGVAVLVVGGGAVAARKVESLASAGAKTTVISPEFKSGFDALSKRSIIRLIRRRFRPADLKPFRMIFAATDDDALNVRIGNLARKAGLLVNVASPPEAGNMQIPATLRRGRLCIAISTGGASAGLSQALRQQFEKRFGPEWKTFTELLHRQRPQILKRIENPLARRRLLKRLSQPAWAARIKRLSIGHVQKEMERLMKECE